MAHELDVWLFADRVGTLVLVDGRLRFCYASGWLSHPDAVALSASLPLQAAPFDNRKTRPFFAGLLPEGQMRRLIAQQFQVSGQNDFALLDHIGGECAGAGAQDKLPVVFDGACIGLPLNGSPSSHILKPAIHAVEDSVVNKGFCMAFAGSVVVVQSRR